MNGEGRRRGGALLTAPLAWLLVVLALAGPLLLSHAGPPTSLAGPGSGSGSVAGADAGTVTGADAGSGGRPEAAPATGMERPDDDTGGRSGVLGLPPKVHLIVNRAGTATAPPAPVLAALPAPVDRTDAGIRVAAERAGTPPAGALPRNLLWGRAPPRASA